MRLYSRVLGLMKSGSSQTVELGYGAGRADAPGGESACGLAKAVGITDLHA